MYTVPKLEDFSSAALDKAVAQLEAAFDAVTKLATTPDEWKTFRDRWLARKNGIITQLNELWLKAAPPTSRKEVGQRINHIRPFIEQRVEGQRLWALSPTQEVVG